MSEFVGNKVKGRFSKRVLQENKTREIFRKNEHFLPSDTDTYVISVCFLENLACFVFSYNLRFESYPSVLWLN